ncbi:MAG: hypothetical protein NC401_15075 [Ruminococcus sp.]|nr:hypothetical protein [Ruminococcus sp.]MCM1439030.1 hypothetical protein [Roseburia sp.]
MKTEFFKCNGGAPERRDELVCIAPNKRYLLIFGQGKDADGNTYTMRKYYDHKPDIAELRADIESLINEQTDTAILDSFVWNGIPVYLSTENQFNFKAAYDMAEMSQGASLPVTFKLGENADKSPVYHTFAELDDFRDFYTRAMSHVITTLNEGWREKDSIDYASILSGNE